MEVSIAQKGNKMYSLGWALQESASLVFTKIHLIMTFFFPLFLCCLSHPVVHLKWEPGEGVLLLQVSLKVKQIRVILGRWMVQRVGWHHPGVPLGLKVLFEGSGRAGCW